MKKILMLNFLTIFIACNIPAETNSVIIESFSTKDTDLKLIQVASGLNHPWSFAFLADSSVLITERRGKLLILKNESITEIEGLPDIPARGQGGLLDIVLHPDFEKNRLVYFSHSAKIGSGTGTAVSRGVFTGTAITGIERIFTSNIGTNSTHHYGSRLVFDNNNYLFITLGERGNSSRAQDIEDHAGSVIRIKDDGSIPDDNPFVTGKGLAEIYTFGHRNQQGIDVDPLSGKIWLHEHGPKGGDEINKLISGSNYGWPLVTYGVNYNGSVISTKTEAPGIEAPLLYWVPSIAPSGMSFYTGDLFPSWKNDIFAGALAGKHLRRIIRNGETIIGEEILLQNTVGRIRDVRTGPDGSLWFITDEDNGGLFKLTPY